ncbi:hypothetical protein NG502_002459 [Escherichia coli]|nr:hypothetical protein [Escherichia coli]
MTKYATNNPLGSMDPKDFFDNAQNLDYAVNDITQAIWKDRFGRNRPTMFGMEQSFSAQLLSQQQRFDIFIQSSGYDVVGEYTSGPLTISEYNQLIRYNNELWKLTAATNPPFTTTGNDAASWLNDSAHFVSVGDAALRQELGARGGSGLIDDSFKPATWSQFAGGADPAGSSDSTAALISAYDAAESGTIIFIPKGMYKEGSETKEIRSDSLWLDRDFGQGVGVTTETRKTPLLITVGNPDEPVLSSEHTRSGINITAIGRGAQHIDCIRATTINYSTNGNGNTAIYGAALSTPGALWTAALHGEIKHQGNSTIAVSAEAASYSDKGTFYGAVLNNTTGTAAETHPTTGAPATLHPSATALYITGSNQRGEMGQWIRGIRFSPLSMRVTGTLVRDESACAQGWWSQPSSSKTNADIFLEGTAPQGVIIQGTYSTGNGIRLASGLGIAYEGTGAIKTRYESSTLRWGLFSGAVERVTFHTATPGMYFNGVRVVAGQQAAINNAAAGTEISTINSILSAMRNHGLIAA